MVRGFVRKARRRLSENLRRMEKNDDQLETAVAKALYARGGYSRLGVFS
jgi:hypothetical protein